MPRPSWKLLSEYFLFHFSHFPPWIFDSFTVGSRGRRLPPGPSELTRHWIHVMCLPIFLDPLLVTGNLQCTPGNTDNKRGWWQGQRRFWTESGEIPFRLLLSESAASAFHGNCWCCSPKQRNFSKLWFCGRGVFSPCLLCSSGNAFLVGGWKNWSYLFLFGTERFDQTGRRCCLIVCGCNVAADQREPSEALKEQSRRWDVRETDLKLALILQHL